MAAVSSAATRPRTAPGRGLARQPTISASSSSRSSTGADDRLGRRCPEPIAPARRRRRPVPGTAHAGAAAAGRRRCCSYATAPPGRPVAGCRGAHPASTSPGRAAATPSTRPPTGDGSDGGEGGTAGGDGRWIPRRRSKGQAPPRVAAVYASPLERTRETAEPIARLLGLEVVPDEGLIELDVGEWTGMALDA